MTEGTRLNDAVTHVLGRILFTSVWVNRTHWFETALDFVSKSKPCYETVKEEVSVLQNIPKHNFLFWEKILDFNKTIKG